MLVGPKIQSLLQSAIDAGYKTFWAALDRLLAYVQAEASPSNRVLATYEADRAGKWAKWPGEHPGRWQLPDNADDRRSLTWDLMRSVVAKKDEGRGLLFHMYRERTPALNVDSFRSDFGHLMVETLQSILDAEPAASGAQGREKQQKFGILDSPTLELADLARSCGVLGRALLFIDLDKFKDLNTRLTNELVDKLILPPLHRSLVACVENLGFAYGKGGDEVTVLLPNASEEVAVAVAKAIHNEIARVAFEAEASDVKLASTIGVAWQPLGEDGSELATRANRPEVFAKTQGRNCVAVWRGDAGVIVYRGATAPNSPG